MKQSVHEAASIIESRGLLRRERNNQPDRVVQHVEALVGQPLPQDLIDFYREGITAIGDFAAILPRWNDHVGWGASENSVTRLIHAEAIPLFYDGCGSLFGLDLTPGLPTPAVYFFDHIGEFKAPEWAAGSSLGTFLLLLADSDRALAEGWPQKWELEIDPALERCPRAPAIWNAD